MRRRFQYFGTTNGNYIYSVNTWAECRPFFKALYGPTPKMVPYHRLVDSETGRVWETGDAYVFEESA